MYKTDAYARIECTKCGNKLVDILMPGKEFTEIKKCTECPKPEAKQKTKETKKCSTTKK